MIRHAFFSIFMLNLSLTAFAATLDWWEIATFYQIYPKSWKDSNGDGIGDLKGITDNLQYLKDIGVTAAWMSPIYESPMVDNGYDISNFTNIDPIFGTLADFDKLVAKAKKIGIKVILDFVPNHSSDKNEWFQKSVNREDGYEDFYVWADGLDDPNNSSNKLPPNNWVSVFDGSIWAWNEQRQQFYLHQFYKQQPDLNYRNKNVHEKMLGVLKFWLDRGIDGFRIDAVPYFYEKVNADGSYPNADPNNITEYTKDQYETAELLYEWREFLEDYRKKNGGDTRVLLAEAYSPIAMIDRYCGNKTYQGAHEPFNFNLLQLNTTSNARDIETLADNWMDVMWTNHKVANWVSGNHDQFRISDRIGKNKTTLMYFLLTALPGVTITYYGEEIGMHDVITCENCSEADQRNYARTPFQWNDGVSAGFSTSNKTWLPIADDYKTVNVKNQKKAKKSPLKVYTALQRLKDTSAFKAVKEEDGFSYGALNDEVFEIVRRSQNEEYRFFINFGNNFEEIGDLVDFDNSEAEDILMKYVVVSENSPHKIGERVFLSEIKLIPFEGVALKKIDGPLNWLGF